MEEMHDSLAELKSWVRFDDAQAPPILKGCLPLIEPHLHRIIDHFYAEILRHPSARNVLEDDDQVRRLKKTLRQWLREVFTGPFDEAYAERRRTIGRRHVQVGLPNRYMTMAMHVIEREVGRVLVQEHPEPWVALEAFHQVCCMDLALMTGTYVSGRERLQLDTLQKVLVEHLRVTVLLVDEAGRVTAATRAPARLMNGGEIIGQPWVDSLPEGLVAAAELERHMERALRRHREVTLPRVDVEVDEVHSYRIHIVPLRHDLARCLIQIEELTDAVAMEARVRRSESLAQLGALSAAVAHELRNPLAGISGALQVITRSMDEEAPHGRILTKVESEVRRLNQLVTDLLAFARPGSATLERTNLGQIALEVVELLERDHPDVTMQVIGEGHAKADPNLVRQILHNLVRNAVDAVEGAGEVNVNVADGSLTVCDSGKGIPKERWESVFEPFVTTKTRGTGLGLAISARSADAMSGVLRIVEGPMPGACMELTLQR